MVKRHSPQRYSPRDLYSNKGNKSTNKFVKFFKMKKGKATLIVLSIILLLGGAVLIGANYYLSKINHTSFDQFGLLSSVPDDEKDASLDPNAPVNNNPDAMKFGTGNILSNANIQNILLIGSDTRGGETYGRSDSMMIISIDKTTKQVKATSILRDTYLKIEGMRDNRINAAYAYGGPKLLKDTIEKNFRVKIDNYVQVDFSSFRKLIDLVGGVQVTLTKAEADELNNNYSSYFGEAATKQSGGMVTFRAGTMTLNGASALGYSRIRHIDSDFGRTQRQRTVITALMSSAKHSNLFTMLNIANEIFPLITTDLTNTQIMDFAKNFSVLTSRDLQQCHLPDNGAYKSQTIRSMSVLVPDIEKNKKVLWKFIYNYAG